MCGLKFHWRSTSLHLDICCTKEATYDDDDDDCAWVNNRLELA